MQKSVEHLYQNRTDPTTTRVEHLRKHTREQFAVMHFAPSDWGDNTKRKMIHVPFLHISLATIFPVILFRKIYRCKRAVEKPEQVIL